MPSKRRATCVSLSFNYYFFMLRLILLLVSYQLSVNSGIHLLHTPLSSALLFISPYVPFFIRFKNPILFRPLGLLPSILPSITSFNNPSPRTICPMHFFFDLIIRSIKLRFSSTISSTSSLVLLYDEEELIFEERVKPLYGRQLHFYQTSNQKFALYLSL